MAYSELMLNAAVATTRLMLALFFIAFTAVVLIPLFLVCGFTMFVVELFLPTNDTRWL